MRWPSEGKNTTIGLTGGVIMIHWGVSPCCTNPPVAKAHHRNDTHTPRSTTEPHPHPQPSPILWGNHCGSDDRDCHTQSLAQPLCPRRSRHHWHLLCTRARHRDGVDMPDAGLHPHREAMNKQHTHSSTQSRCVPFSDPHVHKAARSNDTRQECTPQQRNDNGDQSTIW